MTVTGAVEGGEQQQYPELPGDSEQLRRLVAVTETALVQLDIDDLLTELVSVVRELMAVDTSTILLLEPSGRELVATAASGLEEEVRLGVRVPVGAGFAGQIAAVLEGLVSERVATPTMVEV